MTEVQPECSICLDTETGPFNEIPCNHKFHRDCLKRYIEYNRNKPVIECPLCRVAFITNIPDNPPNVNTLQVNIIAPTATQMQILRIRDDLERYREQNSTDCSPFIYVLILVTIIIIIVVTMTTHPSSNSY
jgi:hypothetical protein